MTIILNRWDLLLCLLISDGDLFTEHLKLYQITYISFQPLTKHPPPTSNFNSQFFFFPLTYFLLPFTGVSAQKEKNLSLRRFISGLFPTRSRRSKPAVADFVVKGVGRRANSAYINMGFNGIRPVGFRVIEFGGMPALSCHVNDAIPFKYPSYLP